MSPEGRTRAAAVQSGTVWQIQNSDIIPDRIRVFVDLINPVTPENTRAIMQTDVFSGDEWIGNVVTNITIAAAWHWCEANAEAILDQKPIGERWSHWDCLKTGQLPAQPTPLAKKIGCRQTAIVGFDS